MELINFSYIQSSGLVMFVSNSSMIFVFLHLFYFIRWFFNDFNRFLCISPDIAYDDKVIYKNVESECYANLFIYHLFLLASPYPLSLKLYYNNGDNASYCFGPVSTENVSEVVWSILVWYCVSSIHILISLISFFGTPSSVIIFYKLSPWILS